MRRRAAALGLLLLVAGSPVQADGDPAASPPDPPVTVTAGPQPAPPVQPAQPVLEQQLDGRRSVRGCAVDETCGNAAEVLREFELGTLPPPGGDPWIVHERTPPKSRLEAPAAARKVQKPSELRPDAPWLDQLALPDLPIRWSKRLVDYLVFYRDDPRGRNIMAGWLVAQGRYRDMIVAHLRKAKLPEDLLYVAMIESSYDPNTLSRAGALGLWQWMPEGSRIYGLRRDRWVDERKDPYRSTIAQMDYFRDLYQRFNEWHIALAAFNVGYGAMLRSIARYNTNDYYQLCEYENAIPWETCWYTPKVMAAAIVGRNRVAFGFDKLKVAAPEVWDEVAVPVSMPLAIIARAAGASDADVKRLNPHLKYGRTPPGEPGYIVRVPAGKQADTQRRLADLQTDWDNYDAYVVAHGERFEDIATTYGITTYALKKLNEVSHESEIEGGTVLVVPRISEAQRQKNRAKAKAKLHSSGIDHREGEPLIVPIPDKTFALPNKRRVFYRVVTGDTLKRIAKAFGVPEASLAAWNAIEPGANLHPKMVLVAYVDPSFDGDKQKIALLDEAHLIVVTRGSAEHLDLAEARTGRVRVEYVAKAKEKLADVAKKYGMGSHDLARINRISYDTVLKKGDKIIVYEVADPKRSQRAEEQWKKTPRHRRGKVSGDRAVHSASAQKDADIDEEADADDDADEERDAASKSKTKDSKTKPSTQDTKARPATKKSSPSTKDSKSAPASEPKATSDAKTAPDEGPVTSPSRAP